MALGPLELAILIIPLWAVPVGILMAVAAARSLPLTYGLWGLLSFVGLFIGLLIMIAFPHPDRRPKTPHTF